MLMTLINSIWIKFLLKWWQLTVPARLKKQGVEVGKDVRFYGMPIVTKSKNSRIRIGDRCVLCSDSRFTDLGVNHPVVLRTLQPNAEIIIGNDCGISGGSICAAKLIEIGDQCLIGANVSIADTDFHTIKPDGRRFNKNQHEIASSAVKIEDNVFIGTCTVVLKGVTVGKNSVIGAMSLVNKNVQSNSIYAGIPAVFIKNFSFTSDLKC